MNKEITKAAFNANMDILCEYIMKAIELTKPDRWSTWDSFAGCQVHHEQSLRDAQKASVKKFLTMVFADKEDQPLKDQYDLTTRMRTLIEIPKPWFDWATFGMPLDKHQKDAFKVIYRTWENPALVSRNGKSFVEVGPFNFKETKCAS